MKKNKEKPPIEYIKECFRYEDGKLYWKNRPLRHFKTDRVYKIWNKQYPNQEAGRIHPIQLRWKIYVAGKELGRHQVVWALHNNQ